jgi:hypothetical protein
MLGRGELFSSGETFRVTTNVMNRANVAPGFATETVVKSAMSLVG